MESEFDPSQGVTWVSFVFLCIVLVKSAGFGDEKDAYQV